MDEKAREARKLYKREWNRKNRDKVKAAQERYWAKKAAELEAAHGDQDKPDTLKRGATHERVQ